MSVLFFPIHSPVLALLRRFGSGPREENYFRVDNMPIKLPLSFLLLYSCNFNCLVVFSKGVCSPQLYGSKGELGSFASMMSDACKDVS